MITFAYINSANTNFNNFVLIDLIHIFHIKLDTRLRGFCTILIITAYIKIIMPTMELTTFYCH